MLLFAFAFAANEVSAADIIETLAGTGQPENNGNSGVGTEVNVKDPFGVEIGPKGGLYITEVGNHRVMRLDLFTGKLVTIAGTGKKGYSGDGGPATEAELNEPYEVRFDTAGNMYFVEMQNQLVRRVDAKTGIITTVAGTGKKGFSGDGGPATEATFSSPHSIDLDESGNIYIADIGNHRIRMVDAKTGIVTTIAGSDGRTLPKDGQKAEGNSVLGPRALFYQNSVLWVALREGHSVFKLDLKTGIWHHIAGSGKKGFSGDGGDPLKATFNGPKGIAVGPKGNVFVVDTENQAIRKIDLKNNVITTIAGQGPEHRGGAGDGGPATQSEMDRPHGICIDAYGGVYIGDTLNHRVRRVRAKKR